MIASNYIILLRIIYEKDNHHDYDDIWWLYDDSNDYEVGLSLQS